MVPDVAAFADPSPGYVIICSKSVQGCGPSLSQTIAFVGGTSAATPLVAGMIALWTQQAKQSGLPRPGFVPPLLYSIAHHAPGSFLDITTGNNSSSACRAAAQPPDSTWRPGSDRPWPIRSPSSCITERRDLPVSSARGAGADGAQRDAHRARIDGAAAGSQLNCR